jgi:hypothetical protein
MTDAADSQALRIEHDQLMAKLSVRRSTEQFAHAGISLFVGLIFCGAAGKLFWDTAHKYAWLGLIPTLPGLALLIYALVRYLRGRTMLAGEHREFERLSALRRSLGIDDAASMLPR